MQALRASAAKHPQTDLLCWSKAGDESADVLSDWSFQMGTVALYKLHSAVVCSGPRRSEKARQQAIRALTPSEANKGSRVTDIAALLPEAARGAILKDAHTQATFELTLNWMYMLTSRFALPSFGGAAAVVPATPMVPGATAASISRDGSATDISDPNSLSRSASTAMDFFSTAIFGTPSKGGGPDGIGASAAASGSARNLTAQLSKVANGASQGSGGGGSRVAQVKPEQIPLLWQLADALQICGLKAALAPLFENSMLPSTFVMEAPAFERLKLLVRALELHTEEIVGALCEQLRLPPPPTAAAKDPAPLRAAMAELAVAAAAVDTARYAPLVQCGLLPAHDAKRLLDLLDQSSLRVGHESQVHDLLVEHFKAAETSPEDQEALWAACRFAFLSPEVLVGLAQAPNVPPKWLALACAQRAAGAAGTEAPKPPAGVDDGEAQRLKPRSFYC